MQNLRILPCWSSKHYIWFLNKSSKVINLAVLRGFSCARAHHGLISPTLALLLTLSLPLPYPTPILLHQWHYRSISANYEPFEFKIIIITNNNNKNKKYDSQESLIWMVGICHYAKLKYNILIRDPLLKKLKPSPLVLWFC